MFKRPPLIATFMTFIGISILCGLGTWQIKRLEWKNNIISSFEHSKENASAIDLSELKEETKFKHGMLTGYFIDASIIQIEPRTQDGKIGKYVYIPFGTENGYSLFVNLGWVPQNWNEKSLKWTSIPTKIKGLIKRTATPGYFTPANDPPNAWYYTDLKAMSDYAAITNGVPAHTFVLENTEQEIFTSDKNVPKPINIQSADMFNNNHKSYTIFWFSMAVTLLIIFILRFCRKTKQEI